MNVHLLLTILVIVLCAGSCVAQSWYTGEEPLRRAVIQKDVLSDCNRNADDDVVNVVSTGIVPGEGMRPSITVELANRHNRTGKKYAVYRVDNTGKARQTGSVKKPVWGVVWGYRDARNYHAVLMRAGNDDFYGYQLPELQFTILTVADGDTLVHSEWQRVSSSAIRPETDYNRLHIVPTRGGYEILLGDESECRIGFCRDDHLFGDRAGIYVGRGACVELKSWKVTPCEYPERQVVWEPEALNEYLRHSTDPTEGVYEFLQASSSSLNTRLGGNYRLTLVANGTNYLLVYESGAQRFNDQWQTGMVKAVLRPTGLANLFDVTWFDAEHKPLKEGVKAMIGDNGVLTLHFSREGVIIEWNRAFGPKEQARDARQSDGNYPTPGSSVTP